MASHDIFEVGLDFLEKSLKSLVVSQDSDSLRYALLYFWTGTELLLKEPLTAEHWSLVFADVGKANKTLYVSGDFVSVDFDATIDRLRGVCQISISTEQKQVLKAVRDKRNKLMHFGLLDSKESILSVIAAALDFIRNKYLPKAFPDDDPYLLDGLLHQLDAYVAHRNNQIAPALTQVKNGGKFIFSCATCHQRAGVHNGETLNCLFCGHEEDDIAVIRAENERNLPDEYNSTEDTEQECCFLMDSILALGWTDKKGLFSPSRFLCCTCGKIWEDLPTENQSDEPD